MRHSIPVSPAAIFAFAENSWTDTIWFSSADFFGSTINFIFMKSMPPLQSHVANILCETTGNPTAAETVPLYLKVHLRFYTGNLSSAGTGFFHLINSSTGELIQANYLTFTGGLGD
jgi:hypothetical protein